MANGDGERDMNIGVAHPLTKFTSSREMVAAMRDAIEVHRNAWERANVLHGEISLANILVADCQPEGSHRVFLHDLDHSVMDPTCPSPGAQDVLSHRMEVEKAISPDDIKRFKERRGSHPFMAMTLLQMVRGMPHKPCYDLESYYWVLIWVVLRHTECFLDGGLSGDTAFGHIFDATTDFLSAALKCGWLLDERRLTVTANEPLTTLMHRFVWLVGISQPLAYMPVPRPELTHSAVLAVFDEALAMDGWLENDWKPWVLLEGADITPRPIVHTTVPGYTNCAEERTMRSKTAAIASLNPVFPDPPLGCAIDSLAPARPSGRKRANEDNDPGASTIRRPRKRIKAGTVALSLAPVSRDIQNPDPSPTPQFEATIAGSSKATTSGHRRRRNGPKATLTPARQPTRHSARIQAQKEKNALRRDSAR
ncbi:hypothetical protein PYCCODRAFT_1428175 [Trametes coccinea BRFM310]|uniref:Fungal-type protein kinase domain-containing protein n=1 Tax=Trametes coccinea (strain BRFM310) TaxID=1353009 RepID=A0A1Y2I9K8_TRAC3|nr:hypothetical protein PYCCODRAFT_1428175 [Trametes coccinea BRFM310]